MLQPLRLEWLDAKDFQDNPHNWRRHPPAQEAALRQLLAEVGWAGAALYNERTKRLIDGHLRKRVLRKGQKIPVLVGNWTAEQELKILLALDPIASMASGDKVALDQLLASVQFENSALDPLLQQLGEIPYRHHPRRAAGASRPTGARRRTAKEVEDGPWTTLAGRTSSADLRRQHGQRCPRAAMAGRDRASK